MFKNSFFSLNNLANTLCPRYPDSPVNRDPTSVPIIRILVNGTPSYLDNWGAQITNLYTHSPLTGSLLSGLSG